MVHIHTHARSQQKHAGQEVQARGQMSKVGFLGLIDHLESAVRGLSWAPDGTEWGDYYEATNYSSAAQEHKAGLVEEFIRQAQPKNVWDLGANTGVFSRIASRQGIPTAAFDIDPAAVEKNYREVAANQEQNLLPLVQDLTNPSPAIGWANQERSNLLERGPADLALALALIHHLAISNNVPLERLADFFAKTGRWLVIEFVPKTDSQVQRLLSTRKDIFPDYEVEGFEKAFTRRFKIHRCEAVRDSERRLYLMERLSG
jgi:ribosomal protein L11 methylase PrmA